MDNIIKDMFIEDLKVSEILCIYPNSSKLNLVEIYEGYCIDINDYCPIDCEYNYKNKIGKK